MSKETLSRLRIFVPGVMFLVVLALLIFPFLSAWYSADPQSRATQLRNFGSFGSTIVTVVVFGIFVYGFGSVYRVLGVRQLLLRRSRRTIDMNIKKRLLDPYLKKGPAFQTAATLRGDHRLLNVFYYFVDNKESLKERAKGVYLNGLLWSSVADAMAMSIFLAGASTILCLTSWRAYYVIVAVAALAVYALLSRFLMPRVVAKHIALGDEQIGFILDLHEPELRAKLEELARSAR